MSEADLPAVLALYEQTFGASRRASWERRRRWEFFDNPVAEEKPPKFLVAHAAEKLVAFLAGLPTRLKIAEGEHAVLLPCDMMASAEARGYNLGWRLTRMLSRSGGVLAHSLACSDAAGKVYNALDWRSIDLAPIAIRPRDVGAVGRKMIERAMPRIAQRFRGALHGVGLAAGILGGAIERITRPRVPRGFEVSEATETREDIDELWLAASPQFPIVGVRDRRFVRWRFLDDPNAHHVFLEARVRDRLRGWTAVTITSSRGLVLGKIMDLFCDPSDEDAVRALLAGALSALASRGAEVCVTKGLHPAIRARVARFFPFRRSSRPARLSWRGDTRLSPIIHDPASWHSTHADGDEDMV
jgi:hypothetical protein